MIKLSQFTDSLFPLYLVEVTDTFWQVKDKDVVEMFDTLSSHHMPHEPCIRLVSKDPLDKLVLELFQVDPLIWSHDFAHMFGYLLYLG